MSWPAPIPASPPVPPATPGGTGPTSVLHQSPTGIPVATFSGYETDGRRFPKVSTPLVDDEIQLFRKTGRGRKVPLRISLGAVLPSGPLPEEILEPSDLVPLQTQVNALQAQLTAALAAGLGTDPYEMVEPVVFGISLVFGSTEPKRLRESAIVIGNTVLDSLVGPVPV